MSAFSRSVDDETLMRFRKRLEQRNRASRSVEPRNGGVPIPAFVKVIGDLGRRGQIHGTVIKRLGCKD
jgi:hypothetical protein